MDTIATGGGPVHAVGEDVVRSRRAEIRSKLGERGAVAREGSQVPPWRNGGGRGILR